MKIHLISLCASEIVVVCDNLFLYDLLFAYRPGDEVWLCLASHIYTGRDFSIVFHLRWIPSLRRYTNIFYTSWLHFSSLKIISLVRTLLSFSFFLYVNLEYGLGRACPCGVKFDWRAIVCLMVRVSDFFLTRPKISRLGTKNQRTDNGKYRLNLYFSLKLRLSLFKMSLFATWQCYCFAAQYRVWYQIHQFRSWQTVIWVVQRWNCGSQLLVLLWTEVRLHRFFPL